MRLTPAEQETIILYDNELDTATVYTHDRKLIGKLKDLEKKHPDLFYVTTRDGRNCVTYSVPKNCVTVRAPYSEARKREQARRAAQEGMPFETGYQKWRKDTDED